MWRSILARPPSAYKGLPPLTGSEVSTKIMITADISYDAYYSTLKKTIIIIWTCHFNWRDFNTCKHLIILIIKNLTWVYHDVFILSRSIFISEYHLFPLAEHCSVSWKTLDLLYPYHPFFKVLTIHLLMLLIGFNFAGGRARQTLGMKGNADIIIRLFFDCPSAEWDRMLQLRD